MLKCHFRAAASACCIFRKSYKFSCVLPFVEVIQEIENGKHPIISDAVANLLPSENIIETVFE